MASPRFRKGIFVSYSHEDRTWLERLRTFLIPHLRGEEADLWDDSRIEMSANWRAEIAEAITSARVAVLLVSPSFLASKFVQEVELPQIFAELERGLTIAWIPVRPSPYKATPLRAIQAAHDPSRPLSSLKASQAEQALVEIAEKIARALDLNAVANALGIIDAFEPEAEAFLSGKPETSPPPDHRILAVQRQETISFVERGAATVETITANDLQRLDPASQKLIRAFERTMELLFERWTELKPKRYAEDPEIRREACERSDGIRKDLCRELEQLLTFLESLGKQLQDHYQHVRWVCAQQGP